MTNISVPRPLLERVIAWSEDPVISGACVIDELRILLAQPTAQVTEVEREHAYDVIDRFLRNNLDDSDYAEYSSNLETLFATAPSVSDTAKGE